MRADFKVQKNRVEWRQLKGENRETISGLRPATLLKKDSGTGVFV